MFKVNECIISTFGTTKGKEFIVRAILKNGFYSCQLKDKSNERYYQFCDSTAIKKGGETAEFTLIRDKKHEQFLTVTGEGVTMHYYEVFKVGSNFIKRSHGEVNGISFSTHKDGYYKKNGRGRIKNEAEVWEKIRNVDSFIYEKGFSFWKD